MGTTLNRPQGCAASHGVEHFHPAARPIDHNHRRRYHRHHVILPCSCSSSSLSSSPCPFRISTLALHSVSDYSKDVDERFMRALLNLQCMCKCGCNENQLLYVRVGYLRQKFAVSPEKSSAFPRESDQRRPVQGCFLRAEVIVEGEPNEPHEWPGSYDHTAPLQKLNVAERFLMGELRRSRPSIVFFNTHSVSDVRPRGHCTAATESHKWCFSSPTSITQQWWPLRPSEGEGSKHTTRATRCFTLFFFAGLCCFLAPKLNALYFYVLSIASSA